jgi:tetratricopeptide (TPR) repeat protein
MATLLSKPLVGPCPTTIWSPVVVLEAPGGVKRANWLRECLADSGSDGARTFSLSCNFALGGPWGGATELFAELMNEIRINRPDLVMRHAFELVYMFPALRKSLTVRNPNLTDLAPSTERTRNYPADRAVRNVHGLIDLLDEWKSEVCPAIPWVIACDSFDDAGAMGSLFFRELARRRSERLKIQLLLGVSPGQAESVRLSFDPNVQTESLKLRFDSPTPALVAGSVAEEEANSLEKQIGDDELDLQANLPRLVHLWSCAGRSDKILHYKYLALDIYNTLGLYADALRYGEGLIAIVSQEAPSDDFWKWAIFIKMLMCHLGLDHVEAGLRLTEEVGLPLASKNAAWRNQLFYLMAMIYARFQKPRDLAKGEEYVERSLAALAESDLPEGERHFRYVFNRNGLAMIRNFQRRPEEAIELCRNGFAYLNEKLDANEHRLHRSILLYNIAQVYAAIGAREEAIEYFTRTMEMDPNYSEYHNDRGNVLLQMDRLEEAKADYLRAIELSPPYFEVFTNLGQCYRRMGAMKDAIREYSRALDLEPKDLLARLGRAKAHEEAGEREAAIDDYSASLALDSRLWEALASRGVLYYEAGRLMESLADIDAAIHLRPDVAELHENRAIVLADIAKLEPAPQQVG